MTPVKNLNTGINKTRKMVGEKTKIRLMNRAELIAELERKGLPTEGTVKELKAVLLQAEGGTGGKSSKTETPMGSRKSSRIVSVDRSKESGKREKAFEGGIAGPGALKKARDRIQLQDGSGTDDDRTPEKKMEPSAPGIIIKTANEDQATPTNGSVKDKTRKTMDEFVNVNDQPIQKLLDKTRTRRLTQQQDGRSRIVSPTNQQDNTRGTTRLPDRIRESSCGRNSLDGIQRLDQDYEETPGVNDRSYPPDRQSDRMYRERYKQQFVRQDDYQDDEARYRPSNNYLDLQDAELKEIQWKEEQKRIREKLYREETERYKEENRRFEAEERRRIRSRLDEELEIERRRIEAEEARRYQDNLTRLRLEEDRRRRETHHLEDRYSQRRSERLASPTLGRRLNYSRDRDRSREYRGSRYYRDYQDNYEARPGNTVELIRRWNVSFDGQENVLNFIERVEELTRSSGIRTDDLLDSVALMLRDEAIFWYRNNRRDWRTWDEFVSDLKSQFLTKDFNFRLEEEINSRKQKEGEPIRLYITEILTLMRRHGQMSEAEKLDKVYRNLADSYKMYIKKSAAVSIEAILKEGSDYENDILKLDQHKRPTVEILSRRDRKNIQKIEQQSNQEIENKRKGVSVATVGDKYISKEHCWKCREKGHEGGICTNPPVKFCSFCGTRDVFTRDCACRKPRWWTDRRPPATQAQIINNQNGRPAPSAAVPGNQNPSVSARPLTLTRLNPNDRSGPLPSAPLPPAQPSSSSNGNPLMKLDDNRPYLNVMIDGHQYRGLVDTGTTRSYLSTDTWKKIKKRNPGRQLMKTGHVASVAGGRHVPIEGKTHVDVWIESRPTKGIFYIMENLGTQMILGVEVMKKIRLKMSFEPEEDSGSEEEDEATELNLGMMDFGSDDTELEDEVEDAETKHMGFYLEVEKTAYQPDLPCAWGQGLRQQTPSGSNCQQGISHNTVRTFDKGLNGLNTPCSFLTRKVAQDEIVGSATGVPVGEQAMNSGDDGGSDHAGPWCWDRWAAVTADYCQLPPSDITTSGNEQGSSRDRDPDEQAQESEAHEVLETTPTEKTTRQAGSLKRVRPTQIWDKHESSHCEEGELVEELGRLDYCQSVQPTKYAGGPAIRISRKDDFKRRRLRTNRGLRGKVYQKPP